MHGIKCLSISKRQLSPLHRFDGETVRNDSIDDFSGVTCASCVWLDHGKCAVGRHGVGVQIGRKSSHQIFIFTACVASSTGHFQGIDLWNVETRPFACIDKDSA
jgi:hypothetical protein